MNLEFLRKSSVLVSFVSRSSDCLLAVIQEEHCSRMYCAAPFLRPRRWEATWDREFMFSQFAGSLWFCLRCFHTELCVLITLIHLARGPEHGLGHLPRSQKELRFLRMSMYGDRCKCGEFYQFQILWRPHWSYDLQQEYYFWGRRWCRSSKAFQHKTLVIERRL